MNLLRTTGWLVLAAAIPLSAAEVRTANFTVRAKQPDVARQVARSAEHYRKTKAVEWLGREMPDWGQPCSVEVKLTLGGAGGATSFAFDNGRILSQQMTVEGSLERIINSVLPHEITHTVFAYKFRRPLPRWADEGGAVLSEDYQELARHDLLVRSLINGGRMIPLARLFSLTEYPRDVMALYAQGFSIANYLVSLRGKPAFLDFVWEGQSSTWPAAAQRHYGFRSLQDLERGWIDWLITGKGTGADRQSAPIATAPTTRENDAAVAGTRGSRLTDARGSSIAGARGSLAVRDPERPMRMARGQMPEDKDYGHDSRFAAANRAIAPADAQFQRVEPDQLAIASARHAAGAAPTRAAIEASPIETIGADRQVKPSADEAAVRPPASTGAPPSRRLIPIAVGRTRRSHSSEDASTSGYGQ